MNDDMSIDPEQIRSQVHGLLAELPDIADETADLADLDIEAVAARLEEAHNVLVRALESVERR